MDAPQMAKRTVKELLEAGLQVTPKALNMILANPDLASLVLGRIRDAKEALVLTEDDVKKIVEERSAQKAASITTPKSKEAPKATSKEAPGAMPILELKPAPTAKEIDEEFEVLMEPTRVIGTSGTLDDFVNYFKDRYMRLSNLLLKRGDIKGAHKTSEVGKSKEVRVIGMVKEISKVRSGSMIIELEDLDGTISVLIPSVLADKARNLMLDQVVCVEGKNNGAYIIADNIIWPDIPFDHKPRRADDPVIAVFISDTHFGSKKFMEKPFTRFLEWLRGERGDEKSRALAKQVKYLVIGGDIVDGVGVYPDQEKELAVEELYAQYETAAKYLEILPDYVKIIAIPGGHDATRQALPQPAIPREYGEPLYEIGVEVLGDPAYFKIHGVEVLCFHGDSLNDVMTALSIDPHHPEKAMVELLRGRHLAPIYGSTPISPEPIDLLVIERVPDVFHCGHLHVNGQENYRGVTVINSGTFQDQTDYQKSMGLTPTPGKPYIINLKDFWIAQLDFTGD